MAKDDRVLAAYRRELDPAEYTRIRELYKAHSIAEDARDLPGLLATLTPDCVYELPQVPQQWYGHDGAARFYGELLGAFPDVLFDLRNIVIGPQGVCEEARVTGTHDATWLDLEPTGERLTWRVAIFFPWDPEQRKFKGEKVYTAGLPVR